MGTDWHGDSFFEAVRDRISANVAKAANELRTDMRILIGIQGPPRSVPGESPHMDTQALRDSVEMIGPAVQGDLIFSSVGTALFYGAILELQMNRPWLSRGLHNNEAKIAATIIGAEAAVS
jgi:hypothetical protein